MNIKAVKKRVKVFEFLFLLVSGMLCSSCGKDDDVLPIQLNYAIFNDQSNPVANNLVTIDFPTETKTELIISGGDGIYSVSNTDNTKLSVISNNDSLELIPLAPGNVIVTIKDSHDNTYTLNVQIASYLRLNINAKSKDGNIFDLMEFNLYAYSEKEFTLLDLTEMYDSIVWTCTNTNQRFRILENSGNSSHFTWKWSNCFFLPATYETCLLGYKDNHVISADTVSVDIVNDKDFLGYNWNEIVSSNKYSTGFHNVFMKEYNFASISEVTDGIPSVYLFLFYNNNENEFAFVQKSRQILFDYISSLYSAPTYSVSDDNSLLNIYDELFRNKKDGTVPECIWITTKSKIVLLKKRSGSDCPEYEIYAEPAQ